MENRYTDCGPGIASGTILTFARAMGEYGATSMLAGNIQGKDGDDRSEDCDGHSGRRLCYGRNLGFGCSSDRFCHYFSYEFHFRTKDEKYREVVKDGD